MKAVDDQLVTVRKVTGFTKDQMAEIEAQAYKTAKAYGVAADAYLENVAAFSRAGYKERASELAELAVKTQLVGDTTAEVANQFLLSVDAAYQYKGNIQELQKVLDGANEIDNKYATSIEKIASGLGIVAPVAKQARVGIDELTAAIGTITAVTQRSGSEAARAFRALALNIIGDTTTEVEDGATWTVGEIAGLRDVLKTYAPEAVRAAEATGKVINPMEAIGGLAKSMKEGLLTEQQLMSMVSDIGGKLRTSQLLALIQNWDMYQSMLKDYRGAVGSADKEVENALDSWTRKSEILKNTWVEFLNNVISTDTIKGALDFFTKAVDKLNTDLGRTVLALGAVNGAIILIGKSLAAAKSENKNAGILALAKEFPVIKDTVVKLAGIATAVAAIYALYKYFDKTADSTKNTRAEVTKLNEEYERMFGKDSEYQTLINNTDKLTEAEKRRLRVLEQERKEQEAILKEAQDRDFRAFMKEEVTQGRADSVYTPGTDGADGYWETRLTKRGTLVMDDLRHGLDSLTEEYKRGLISEEQYKDALTELSDKHAAYYDDLVTYTEQGRELDEEQQKAIAAYEAIADVLEKLNPSQETFTETVTEQAEKVTTLLDRITALGARYDTLVKAQQESDENGRLSVATLTTLNEKYPELIQYLTLTENGYILTAEAVAKYTDNEALVATGADKVINASMLKAHGFDTETMSVRALLEAMLALYQAEAQIAGTDTRAAGAAVAEDIINSSGAKIEAVQNALDALDQFEKARDERLKDLAGGGSSGGGGGGSSAKSQTDAVLDGHKKTVALLKSELDLMEKQGASGKDRIDKLKDIQGALHDEAEYLRSIGAEQTEINALSSEWWDIEKQIRDIQKEIVDELKAAVDAQLEQAAAVRDAKIDALDKQLDALKEARDVEQDRLTLEEKQLAVEEARAALEEARNERHTRYYNAATGQWEWGANGQSVKSAEEALANAEKALADYQEEMAYEAAVKEIEAQKDAINAAYDALKSEWDAILKSLEEPTRAIGDILNDLASVTLPQVQASLEAFAAMVGAVSGGGSGGNTSGIPAGKGAPWTRKLTHGGITTDEIYQYGDWDSVRSMTPEEMQHYLETGQLPEGYQFVHYAGPSMGEGDGYDHGQGYDRYWMDDDYYEQIQQYKREYEEAKARGDTAAMEEAHRKAEALRARLGYSGGDDGTGYEPIIVYAPPGSNLYDNSLTGKLNSPYEPIVYGPPYDSGGILRGLGGIKATRQDEIVLPPDVTNYLLRPSADSRFRQRMNELRFFYGTGTAKDRAGKIGSKAELHDHSGAEYHFGNITLSEERAKNTSVFELAKMSKNLIIYNHA